MSLSALEKHSVTEFAPPQLFLCVNRNLIRFDFRDGEKTIRHSVKTALQLHTSTMGMRLVFANGRQETVDWIVNLF